MTAAPRKLRTLQLAAVIFLTVSGGPYGLESLLADAGANAALLLLLITPILWDVPTIFVVLELNSMMPVSGGYYQWVKRAFGLKWAFFEGWWTWLYTFADLAIYPVMFVDYLSFFYPDAQAWKIPICLAIIWTSAAINIRGIVPVGKASIVLSVLVLIPILVLFGWALVQQGGQFRLPPQNFAQSNWNTVGIGLYTIMWNFIGWDNVTTYADEVDHPVKAYLKSVSIAFLLVLGIYVLATLVALQSGIDPKLLEEGRFPVLAELVGGRGLGAIVAIGGMASAMGLFSAVLLSVSRIPKVMADDKLLPKQLDYLHPRFRSPYISIIVCAIVVSGMVVWTFGELLIIDITLYGAALLFEYLALIRLRRKMAGAHRPFRIPLNRFGLLLMTLLPLSVYVVAMAAAIRTSEETVKPLLFALCALLSAPLIWILIRGYHRLKGVVLLSDEERISNLGQDQ